MKYAEYMQGEFAKKAVEFIVCTGLWNPKMSQLEIVNNINIQMEQVKEESLELLTAYGTSDVAEKIDGIIDLHFTLSNFEYMVESFGESYGDNPKEAEALFSSNINAELLNFIGLIVPEILKLPQNISPDLLLNSAKLVIANNSLKYTKAKEEAESWEFDKSSGIELVETVVDGVSWYCLKDQNGKVRKHKNFQKVDIESLVRGANE